MGTTSTMKRGRPVRWAVAAGAAAAALSLAGCNGEDGASAGSTETKLSPVELVSAAAQKTSEQKTANFTIDVETKAAGQTIPISGKGQMDTARKAMRMELSMSQGGESITLKQVLIDDTVYMSGIPGMAGGKWVKLSMKELNSFSGTTAGSDANTDPSQQLQLLSQVSDDVKEAGTETVNGVRTTKYTGTIDLNKAAKAQGADGAKVAEMQKQYKALGLSTLPFELYLDDDGLPMRMRTTMETSGAKAAQGEKMSAEATIDFTDWGAAVDIQAPKKAVPYKQALREMLGT